MKRIGIDTRLQNETGVGRYIRNLVSHISSNTSFEYISVNPEIAWHSISEQIKLPRVLNEQNLDLVHFPYFSVPMYYNKPFVVTIHDLIIDSYDTGRASTHSYLLYKTKRLAYKKAMNHAVQKAKAIIVPSNATKQELTNRYTLNTNKIHVIYEGIDESLSSHLAKKPKKLKNTQNQNFFLYVGNAYPHKNIQVLIQAMRTVSADSKLVMVGKDDYFYKKLKSNLRKEDKGNIVFIGYVSDAELSWLYSHTRATIAPSFMEGFGLPALEAMHHGSLVIASNIPVYKEICQDVPLYFEPTNSNELAKVMERVLQNPQDYMLRKEKGICLSNKYSWKNTAKQTIKVYERCLSI